MAQWVAQIYLRHFRNYRELHLSLSPGMHLFLGPNGAGKTNFLEAVHFLATGHPMRGTRAGDLVQFEQQQAYLKARVKLGTQEVSIEWMVDRKLGKAAKLNGLPVRRQQEITQLMPVVYFCPDHIQLLKGSPNERRGQLDELLRQLYPSYGHDLLRYQQALKQRNEVLRQIAGRKASLGDLEYWEEPLFHHGLKIIEKRMQMVEQLGPLLTSAYRRIANSEDELGIVLLQPYAAEGQTIASSEDWQTCQKRWLQEELRRGYTMVGPHRDDYRFTLGSADARHFASQGQQRSIVLSLLFSELRLIENVRHQKALLLLDDVFSELDEQRRNQLIELLTPEQQTFLTATDWSSISPDQPPPDTKVFRVEHGAIRAS